MKNPNCNKTHTLNTNQRASMNRRVILSNDGQQEISCRLYTLVLQEVLDAPPCVTFQKVGKCVSHISKTFHMF